MSDASKIVLSFLEKRHEIQDLDTIKITCNYLFELALIDCDATEALFAKTNRFVQNISAVIPEKKLLLFARIHSQPLVKKLIQFAGLSNTQLEKKIWQEHIKQQTLDNAVQFIRKPILPNKLNDESIGGRTYLAIKYNPLIQEKNNTKGIMLDEEFIPIVTRDTRDFNKKLCSVGSSTTREVILLDPSDKLLTNLYKKLKTNLSTTIDQLGILNEVKMLTQECMTGKKSDSFIKKNLDNGKQIISLSEFISVKQGRCRHHALLNAYLLSCLIQDGLLQGEVIHHRQNFAQERAHTWNVFHDQNGKVYSLDSLWNNVTCITDNPGAINSLYKHEVEAKINEMHFKKQVKEYPENKAQANFKPDLNMFKDLKSPTRKIGGKIENIENKLRF